MRQMTHLTEAQITAAIIGAVRRAGEVGRDAVSVNGIAASTTLSRLTVRAYVERMVVKGELIERRPGFYGLPDGERGRALMARSMNQLQAEMRNAAADLDAESRMAEHGTYYGPVSCNAGDIHDPSVIECGCGYQNPEARDGLPITDEQAQTNAALCADLDLSVLAAEQARVAIAQAERHNAGTSPLTGQQYAAPVEGYRVPLRGER